MRFAILPALLLAGCALGEIDTDIGLKISPPSVVHSGKLARGITIHRIGVMQGSSTLLVEDRQKLAVEDRSVQIVAGREALVRVFVDIGDNFVGRELAVVMTIETGGETTVKDYIKNITTDSVTDDKESTINFKLEPELVKSDTTFKVEIFEPDPQVEEEGPKDQARWPTSQMASLNAQPTDRVLIKLFPIKYNADGSGRVPDMSDEHIAELEERMMQFYPVKAVKIEVQPVYEYNYRVEGTDQQAWGRLLQRFSLMREQNSDTEDDNTYYYGMFNPDSNLASYCGWGCILGLGTVGRETDTWSQASIGLGFRDNSRTSVETMVHEVGHALGREHGNCGTRDYDPRYPYYDAELGVYGYDLFSGDLISPTKHKDFMSYCTPTWISDYHANLIHERVVAHMDSRRSGVPHPYRMVAVDGDGNVTNVKHLELRSPPGGQVRSMDLIDKEGWKVGQTEGRFTPYTHIDGGLIFVPEPGDDSLSLMPALR